MPEGFPCENIGQVNFDKRNGDAQQGITYGDAGVSKSAGINDNKVNSLTAGFVDALDNFFPVIV